MPKLTETYVGKLPQSKTGTLKHWDSELRGLVLFVGKKAKTWYFQKDVGGQTKRVLIGRYPVIKADVARQTALGFALERGRVGGKEKSKWCSQFGSRDGGLSCAAQTTF